jgi:hypothetical protein
VARPAVEVRGLKELQRELKAAGAQLPRELGRANKEAADIVASAGRARAQSEGGVAAKAAPGIVASGAQGAAKVAIGGSRYPFGIGAETGAKRYPQFQAYVGLDTEGAGYALGPAIVEQEERFIDIYGDVLERLLARAFPV